MNKKNVLVIGAGVSGLTTALSLLRAGHAVTIWSKESASEFPSTSLNAYAMWVPVKIDADPRIERWTDEGFAEFDKLSRVAGTGVAMKKIVVLKTHRDEPWFAGKLSCFRHAVASELTAQYVDGNVLDGAPVIDPTVYLPWLRAQVVALGGNFVRKTVASLSEASADFEVVVNCTSLGSRELAADAGVYPQRMQVVTVKGNGFSRVVIDDEGPNQRACIVPHGNYIKLGAVFDMNGESLEVDNDLVADIIKRCNAMAPDLNVSEADVLSVVRALRPERSMPRVEKDTLADGRTLIHNYGHDGMGYILSHGIAAEIASYLA